MRTNLTDDRNDDDDDQQLRKRALSGKKGESEYCVYTGCSTGRAILMMLRLRRS